MFKESAPEVIKKNSSRNTEGKEDMLIEAVEKDTSWELKS